MLFGTVFAPAQFRVEQLIKKKIIKMGNIFFIKSIRNTLFFFQKIIYLNVVIVIMVNCLHCITSIGTP